MLHLSAATKQGVRYLLFAIMIGLLLIMTGCSNTKNNKTQNSNAQNTGTQNNSSQNTNTKDDTDPTPTNNQNAADATLYKASTLETAPDLPVASPSSYDYDYTSPDFIRDFAISSTAKVLENESGNTCYSPISLFFPLALASLGASGDTQAQILEGLCMNGMTSDEIREAASALFQKLYFTNETSACLIANSLWMNELYRFRDDFKVTASDSFFASLFTTDFSDANTGKDMTEWISVNTKGLLAPDIQVDESNVLAIINTLYYKAHWSLTFDESQTDTKEFTLADGSAVETDFINTTNTNSDYYFGENYTSATLYLMDQAGSVTFILPNEGTTPKEIIASSDTMREILDHTSSDSRAILHYSIPMFSYDTKMNLIPALESMGIKDAFDPGLAQFDSIVADPAEGLYVGQVEQGTHIGIDEEGIEAAAYTIMMFETTAMLEQEPQSIDFLLNRPFAYVVRDSYDNVLFIGEVTDPSSDTMQD